MLIDAGNELDGLPIATFLLKKGVRKIDHFVITHPHEDHLGGADSVIELLSIEKNKKEEKVEEELYKEMDGKKYEYN